MKDDILCQSLGARHAVGGVCHIAATIAEPGSSIWETFVFLVGLSGTASLARSTIGPIRDHPRSRAFLHDVAGEVSRLSGDVVERGARLGVATPCNRATSDILSIYSDGRVG
ncbi:MAG TPA: hypothetical protein VF070_33990 [Streptosporangiaceae bacterium]